MTAFHFLQPFSSKGKHASGFTLVELLAVVGVMAILMTLTIVGIRGLSGSSNLSNTAYQIAAAIDQAHGYALAKNTYVFLGLSEKVINGNSCLVMATVASKDGTKNYSETSSPGGASLILSGSTCLSVGNLIIHENLHLLDELNPTGVTGAMARPCFSPISSGSSANFSWPLLTGSQAASGTGGKYQFEKVLIFNPQGSVDFRPNAGDTLLKGIEIAVQQTHGTAIPPVPTDQNVGKHAVIQVDGLTGSSKIYIP